jgi:predicted Zn-ribbon and HTH transcriptional regulator
MGCQFDAKCLDCGKTFTVDEGGGFQFHLVRCDKCGRSKTIGFEQLGDLHLQYLKGLPVPYSIMSTERDQFVRDHVTLEPISEEDYHKGIEALAGKCRCGGKYTLDAAHRCPKCRSTNIEEGEITVMYD